MQCRYRIVISIDEGGIGSVIPLRILSSITERIEAGNPQVDISSWADVFSGSSLGAVIGGALMLQDEDGKAKHRPQSILDFYLKRGSRFFEPNIRSKSVNATNPYYFVLDHFFGSITHAQINKHFLFVSYDLNSDKPFLFTDSINRFRELTLAKIMQGCTAFPGVFPPLQLGNMLLANGLIATKNPSILAYEYTKKLYPYDPVILISIGTGAQENSSFDIFEREMKLVHKELEGKRNEELIYFRFQPIIEKASLEVKDASHENVLNLLADTDVYIEENKAKFDELISLVRTKAGLQIEFI